MPVFRTYTDSMQGFMDTLMHYVRSITRQANISVHYLNAVKQEETYFGVQMRDMLLIKEGSPIMAVRVLYRPTTAPMEGYVTADSYAGAGNLEEMGNELSARLQKEGIGLPKNKEQDDDEAKWTIAVRAPDFPTKEWKGNPFDIDQIEAAFSYIVDTIIAKNKPTKETTP